MNILLIEDDAVMAAHICEGLQAHGHVVELASDGTTGLRLGADARFDVLVVDRMLPQIDGLSLVQDLRTQGVATPAIFLTAMSGVADRVEGLKAGGDDYLVKPFDLAELDARLEVLGRRRPAAAPATIIKVGDLVLDRLARKARLGEQALDLTTSEFKMLETLLVNLGSPVTKAMLLETVFDLESAAPAVIIEPHISRLRAKLARTDQPDIIRTVRGIGYRILAP